MPKVIDDEAIFQAVVKLFIERGYGSATTKEIAAIAGIHEATLFRKFGSKISLFEQAIAYQFADTPLHDLRYSGELNADLLAVVNAYIETNAIYGEILTTIISQIPQYPELKNAITTPWANIQIIFDIIDEYQKQGVLVKESPLTSISVLIGPYMISQMWLRAVEDLPIPTIDPQEQVEYFLHGRSING